jgi:formate C-acetyltransferase
MQYDKDEPVISGNDHELEMGIGIGGCDPDGKPVYNEITSMAIRAHREMKCVFPKIHARFGSDSPREYLEELAEEYVNGRSVIGLSCDDGIIPALVYTGKTLEDARSYETVGCWENKVPKKESMAGGNYVYLVPILEQAVYGPEQKFIDAGFKALPLENAESFEDVYNIMLDNARRVIRFRCETIGTYGKKLIYRINPLCLSSALMDGCIESRKDYTQGGGIYNINTCELAGFANYVDAMLVIKKLCFDEKTVTINELFGAVRNNWEGNEELLHKARSCPHFCDNTDESNALAQRLHLDLCKSLEGIENEHGGTYHLNYYVYREFIQRSKDMRATPDGRRNGDYFAQGIGPSKYHEPDSLSDVCQSVCALDRNKYITGSLDIQLPFGKTTKEQLVVLLLTFAKLGIKHLQINCVDLETLKKARQNPELYQDLVVRVTGFSAKFVSLSEEFQDEFIRRHTYEE